MVPPNDTTMISLPLKGHAIFKRPLTSKSPNYNFKILKLHPKAVKLTKHINIYPQKINLQFSQQNNPAHLISKLSSAKNKALISSTKKQDTFKTNIISDFFIF